MVKKRSKARSRQGLQAVTLCISTALVLILLGVVVLSVLTARNTSAYVKENLVITMLLEQDMTTPEAKRLCTKLDKRPYIKHLQFVSKEQALREQTKALGSDPTEFTGGVNPFLASVELTLHADYANNDSLRWISAELRKYPKVSEITYQKDLVESVNRTLAKVSIALLVLAVLLTFVSFSLINNTVRLGIYARRFTIHTMKLVGASWGFIRRPFVRQAVGIGLLAALLACMALGGCVWALYNYEPDILTVLTWQVMAVTGATVFLFGIIITAFCAGISVNKFLRMKAGDLYKI
ncbi:MAG: permease-like cell division protein FtsX [Prevotella sp.]|nr:permease-like cell division protein FtsX [Bacteroidales bacterium]MDD6746171.1 permease-like cell division protein FtsX [Bacteroidales bacterium]MDY3843118.1 permease-like cell division protein FtsX [Prevotella sp.]